MKKPTTYWRLNYATDAVLEEMLSKASVISSDKDFVLSLQPSHGVLLARFDEHAVAGIVRAIGVVLDIDRATGLPVMEWKRVSDKLYPSVQGQRYWRQAKPYFAFAKDVVKKYRLPDLFAQHFSQATTAQKEGGAKLNESGGYVYVIKSDHGYKIGKTKRMKDRAQLFSVKLPFPIEVVHYAWFDDYSATETELHRLFQSKRLGGEWFDLSPHDLDRIKQFSAAR
jgi:hypothetical protein